MTFKDKSFDYDRARQECLSEIFNALITDELLEDEIRQALIKDEEEFCIDLSKYIAGEPDEENEYKQEITIHWEDSAFLELAARVKQSYPAIEEVELESYDEIRFTLRR